VKDLKDEVVSLKCFRDDLEGVVDILRRNQSEMVARMQCLSDVYREMGLFIHPTYQLRTY